MPVGKKRLVLIAAVAAALVGVPLVVLFLSLGSGAGARRDQFDSFLESASGQDTHAVERAISRLPQRGDLLRTRQVFERMLEASSESSERLAESRDGWVLAKEFWQTVLLSGVADLDDVVAVALGRLRHLGVLIHAREELFPGPEEMPTFRESEKLKKSLFGTELLEDLLSGDTPPVLLWDRANTAELADRPDEALDAVRAMSLEKVIGHWELDLRKYPLMKAELLGRIRRKLAENGATGARGEIDLDGGGEVTDEELRRDLDERTGNDRERRRSLYRALFLHHRDRYEDARRELDRFLELSEDADGGGAGLRPLDWQLATLYRALTLFESATGAYRRVQPPAATRERASESRERLERRLARLFAELRSLEDFDQVISRYFPQTRKERPLLAHLRSAVWGTPREQDAGRRGIVEFLRLNPRVVHRDDLAWWEAVASGEPLREPDRLMTLFRAGRIYDDLGDIDGLLDTARRMEFHITDEEELVYLEFLRTLHLARRRMLIEAWEKLRDILRRERLPAIIDRGFLIDLVEEVEEDMESLRRARRDLHQSADALERLQRSRDTIDPDVAVAADAWLWQVRFTGLLHDQHSRWGSFDALHRQLLDAIEVFDGMQRVSFFQERAWLALRDFIIRDFEELYFRGRSRDSAELLEQSLDLLDALAVMQHNRDDEQLVNVHARVHELLARIIGREHGREAARETWRRVGRMLRDAARKSPNDAYELVKEAARAFDRAGDPLRVLEIAAPRTRRGADRDLLELAAMAQVRLGDYEGAVQTFDRLLGTLARGDVPAVDFNVPALEANHAVVPDEVSRLFEFEEYVDPVNGVGPGVLIYSARKRALRWQAPSDARPGPEFVFDPNDVVVLESDQPHKTVVLVAVCNEDDFPEDDRAWEVLIDRRDSPLEPADVYFWRATARIHQARLPQFAGRDEIIEYGRALTARRTGSGDRRQAMAIIEIALRDAYGDPQLRAETEDRLRQKVAFYREGLMTPRTTARQQRRINERRIADLDAVVARLGTLDGALDLLRLRNLGFQSDLAPLFGELVREWIDRRPAEAKATFEQFARRQLDEDARRDLVFLCENFSSRDRTWKGAMYMRAYQYFRMAREQARLDARATSTTTTTAATADPAALEERARELLTRLALSFDNDEQSFPTWEPRALYLLGQLWASAERWDLAHHWFDRLARWNVEPHRKTLLREEVEEIDALKTSAAVARADASYRAGEHARALREYAAAEALVKHLPIVLWVHYQKGNCHVRLGERSEALKEFRRGQGLLQYAYRDAGNLEHWLTGARWKTVGDVLGGLLPDTAGEIAAGGGGSTSWYDHWRQLYAFKIKSLSPGGGA